MIHFYIAYVPIVGFKHSQVTSYIPLLLVVHFNYVLITKYASDFSDQAYISAWGVMLGSMILCICHLLLFLRCK